MLLVRWAQIRCIRYVVYVCVWVCVSVCVCVRWWNKDRHAPHMHTKHRRTGVRRPQTSSMENGKHLAYTQSRCASAHVRCTGCPTKRWCSTNACRCFKYIYLFGIHMCVYRVWWRSKQFVYVLFDTFCFILCMHWNSIWGADACCFVTCKHAHTRAHMQTHLHLDWNENAPEKRDISDFLDTVHSLIKHNVSSTYV